MYFLLRLCFYFSPKYSIHPHRFYLQLTAAQNFIFSPSLYLCSLCSKSRS